MPRPETSSQFINIPVIIAGLRTENISIQDGIVYLGCLSGTLDEVKNFTDQQLLTAAGQNAVDWWVVWKPILVPLFEQIIKDQQRTQQVLDDNGITMDEYNVNPSNYV